MGLNSGEVIAGEIGSGAMGYTAVGDQVGMAQRMESVAPPGAVMLSESTAWLVEGAVALGDPKLVQIKGADEPAAKLKSSALTELAPRLSDAAERCAIGYLRTAGYSQKG